MSPPLKRYRAKGDFAKMPEHVKPMLARAGSLPAEERGWVYEIKWDGVRAIAYSSRASCAWRAAT